MSHTLELLSNVEHGTVAGYEAGCHGSQTSCGALLSCAEAYSRFQGDWGFRKRVNAGEKPVDIAAEELADLDAVRARDKAANRQAKAEGAKAAHVSDQQKRSRRTSAPRKPRREPARVRLAAEVSRLTIEEGMMAKAIAERLGVSTTIITRIRRDLELPDNRSRIDRDEVTRLNGLGWNDSRIADHLGVSGGAVSLVRRDLGLGRVRPGDAESQARQDRRVRIVRDLHAEGRTDGEIADALGMPRSGAWQIRERLGLPRNPAGRQRGAHDPGEANQ